jgi:predicted nicotinamide N-methyase
MFKQDQAPSLFINKNICELGCGLGAVSLLLTQLCAYSKVINPKTFILATDGDDDTLDLLQENIKINFPDSPSFSQLHTEKLWWGIETAKSILKKNHVFVPTCFDVILASDVVYEDEQVQPLVDCVATLLQSK